MGQTMQLICSVQSASWGSSRPPMEKKNLHFGLQAIGLYLFQFMIALAFYFDLALTFFGLPGYAFAPSLLSWLLGWLDFNCFGLCSGSPACC